MHTELLNTIALIENALPGWWWQIRVELHTNNIRFDTNSVIITVSPDNCGADRELLDYRTFDDGFSDAAEFASENGGTIYRVAHRVVDEALEEKIKAITLGDTIYTHLETLKYTAINGAMLSLPEPYKLESAPVWVSPVKDQLNSDTAWLLEEVLKIGGLEAITLGACQVSVDVSLEFTMKRSAETRIDIDYPGNDATLDKVLEEALGSYRSILMEK